VTDARRSAVADLVALGLASREARWLVDEFYAGGDRDAWPALRHAAQRRLQGEPLQYIIGHWPFRSLDLDIDPRVLIPRPETEGLVDVALGELARVDAPAPLIVDLGCGSGAIGLSLLDELRRRGVGASLVAIDESVGALEVARANARKHQLVAVSFVQSDWFTSLDESLAGRVDLIVANPPYVTAQEMAVADPALRYEPQGALVSPGARGEEDAVTIMVAAPHWLRPGASLVLEHGDTQGELLVSRAREIFAEVRDHDDLSGRPRVLVGRT
jgi:release factor glutamine methyltransferase